ncbi:MAG: hypothetical protein Q9184_006765 [Pyrenodesmia sp. 2 TL-2023]
MFYTKSPRRSFTCLSIPEIPVKRDAERKKSYWKSTQSTTQYLSTPSRQVQQSKVSYSFSDDDSDENQFSPPNDSLGSSSEDNSDCKFRLTMHDAEELLHVNEQPFLKCRGRPLTYNQGNDGVAKENGSNNSTALSDSSTTHESAPEDMLDKDLENGLYADVFRAVVTPGFVKTADAEQEAEKAEEKRGQHRYCPTHQSTNQEGDEEKARTGAGGAQEASS